MISAGEGKDVIGTPSVCILQDDGVRPRARFGCVGDTGAGRDFGSLTARSSLASLPERVDVYRYRLRIETLIPEPDLMLRALGAPEHPLSSRLRILF
jgi:hypothetical protein